MTGFSTIYPNICANKLHYIVLVCFGIVSWISINAVFAEMPLLILSLPERWTLPSTLSLVIQIANIAPVILSVLKSRKLLGWIDSTVSGRPPTILSVLIYFIISLTLISCFLLSRLWHIHSANHSYPLIMITFVIAMCSTSSSLVFFDYVHHYRSLACLNAVMLGMSLSGMFPPLLVLAQTGGRGGGVCDVNGTFVPDQQEKYNFSESVMFIITGMFVLCSLLSFLVTDRGLLKWKRVATETALGLDDVTNDAVNFADADSDGRNKSKLLGIDSRKDKSTCNFNPTIRSLLFISLFNSFMVIGILPALSSYSMIPYSHKTYVIGSILSPLSVTAAILLGLVVPLVKMTLLIPLLSACILSTTYIVAMSVMSPCPFMAGTAIGSVLIISAWTLLHFLSSFIRLLIANQIKKHDSSKLFWFGAAMQAGGFLGALPMYLIVGHFKLIKDSSSCVVNACALNNTLGLTSRG